MKSCFKKLNLGDKIEVRMKNSHYLTYDGNYKKNNYKNISVIELDFIKIISYYGKDNYGISGGTSFRFLDSIWIEPYYYNVFSPQYIFKIIKANDKQVSQKT